MNVWVLLESDLSGEADEPSGTTLFTTKEKAKAALNRRLHECGICDAEEHDGSENHAMELRLQVKMPTLPMGRSFTPPNDAIVWVDDLHAYATRFDGLADEQWSIYEQEVQ